MVSDSTEVANLRTQPRELPARHRLSRDLATALIRWAQMPDLALAANNPAAFIHDMDARSPASRERVAIPMGPIVDGRHSLMH
jgi:hypothetical protein